ncbi:MAG: hypothetical protein HXX17_13265 [Geobacteraceae bacterium]|nr:hypothetical protein [Geobacteraceae bacterium]
MTDEDKNGQKLNDDEFYQNIEREVQEQIESKYGKPAPDKGMGCLAKIFLSLAGAALMLIISVLIICSNMKGGFGP